MRNGWVDLKFSSWANETPRAHTRSWFSLRADSWLVEKKNNEKEESDESEHGVEKPNSDHELP